MSSQRLLPSSSHRMQQGQPLLEFRACPTAVFLNFSIPHTPHNLLPRLSRRGTLEGLLGASRSGAQKFVLFRGGAPSPHGRIGQCLTLVCRSRSVEDSQLGDGPVEPQRPGFSRLPHSSLSYIPADDPAAAPLPLRKIKISPRRARQRRWKKATPVQALAGAVFGGLWAALALKGTILAYEHLDAHPPAHDLPMGLTNNVNQVLITMVTGLGGFAVVMFGVSSFGLALLTLKLLSAEKPPMQ